MSAGTSTPTINTVAVTTTDLRLMFEGPACSYIVGKKKKTKKTPFLSTFWPSPDKTTIEPESVVNRPTVTGTEPWSSCISPDPMSSAWQRTKCSGEKNNVARILATFQHRTQSRDRRLTRLVLYGSTNKTNALHTPVASSNALIAAMYGFLLDVCDLQNENNIRTYLYTTHLDAAFRVCKSQKVLNTKGVRVTFRWEQNPALTIPFPASPGPLITRLLIITPKIDVFFVIPVFPFVAFLYIAIFSCLLFFLHAATTDKARWNEFRILLFIVFKLFITRLLVNLL